MTSHGSRPRSFAGRVHLPNLGFARLYHGRARDLAASDLVTARAVLHHVADPKRRSRISSQACDLRRHLLIEPVSGHDRRAAGVRTFWSGWLAWSREQGIDYQIGRTLAPRLAALGLERIGGTAETAIYNGTSLWADYWTLTVKELRDDLMSSGKLSNALVDTFLGYCADPAWWTQTIAFTAVHGYAPGHY